MSSIVYQIAANATILRWIIPVESILKIKGPQDDVWIYFVQVLSVVMKVITHV